MGFTERNDSWVKASVFYKGSLFPPCRVFSIFCCHWEDVHAWREEWGIVSKLTAPVQDPGLCHSPFPSNSQSNKHKFHISPTFLERCFLQNNPSCWTQALKLLAHHCTTLFLYDQLASEQQFLYFNYRRI